MLHGTNFGFQKHTLTNVSARSENSAGSPVKVLLTISINNNTHIFRRIYDFILKRFRSFSEFCRSITEFCHSISEFCHSISEFYHRITEFYHRITEFCHRISEFYHGFLRRNKGKFNLKYGKPRALEKIPALNFIIP